MANEDDVKPSSSDAIIASLISEVRKTNEPFDVKTLIGANLEITADKGTGSHSSSRKHSKKSKRHKERRMKKSKKSKHKIQLQTKSPSRKKKKYRNHSRSASRERKNAGNQKLMNYAIPPSVEAVMEKISDDEDDLPMGADFLSVSASSSKIDEKNEELLQDITTAVQNKTKEFNVNEELFPLAKQKEEFESPLIHRKPRPLSEILAKVRAERDSALVPRNVKLKRENAISKSTVFSRAVSKSNGTRHDDSGIEYGPRPLEPLGPQPISDDEDDLHSSSLKVQHVEESKSIKFSAIRKMLVVSDRRDRLAEGSEIPVSDISAASSSSSEAGGRSDVDGSDGGLFGDKILRSEHGLSGYESEIKQKTAGKKGRKEERVRRHEKQIRKRNISSSSDSENEWKRLEKRKKMKDHLRHSNWECDKGRRRHVGLYVQSYYVDSNKRVHEGSKWQWQHGEKDVKERSSLKSIAKRSKKWRQTRAAKSPTSERKRKMLSGTSSCSGSSSRSRRRSSSGSGSSSSRSSYHHRSRNSYRPHHHFHYYHYHHHKHNHHRDLENTRRSRSEESSSSYKIDKKKLLEIAQRNAAQMAQLGCMPNATPELRAQLKAGCQSVDQLVDFCQKLQRSQDKATRREKGEDVSSDDDFAPRKRKSEEETDFLKHPFTLKSAAPITINIPNSVPLPIKTPAQRTLEENQLRIAYPVSSGAQHRDKDNEWTPVHKEEVPAVCSPAQKTKLAIPPAYGDKKKVLGTGLTESFVLPPPPTPPIFSSLTQSPSFLLNLPPPPPPPDLFSGSDDAVPNQLQKQQSSYGSNDGNIVDILKEEFVIKETESLHETPTNVAKVMVKRLSATKMIAKDPNDFEARRMLKEADDQIKAWAESKKNLPGKFTGSTGVNILKADQLGPENPRFSPWVKKDLFKKAKVVNSGVGLKLMQKMGWIPGEGLGKGRDGPLEPLLLDIKSDRRGLLSMEELPRSKENAAVVNTSGKHPVSMLMELCSKKRWPLPHFICKESGPSNNRRFLWKAVVNGVEYQPSIPSTSKKIGKAQACQVVLLSLGLLPQDPSLPLSL